MPVLPSLIGAGTSLIGGLIGSSASSKAAKQQAAAGQAVAGQIDKSTGEAINAGYAGMGQANTAIDTGVDAAKGYISDTGAAQKDLYAKMTAGISPYSDAGTYGLDKMKSQGDFKFTPQDLENDPGYKFQLEQGMKALQSSAAARGMLQSGSLLKSAMGYNQGLAGTSFQNAYNRALSTFDTNRAGYQTLANLGQTANSQQLQAGGIYGGQLTSLANLGTNASLQGAGLKSNVAMQGNEYIGNTGLQGAEAAGNARLGVANSQAAGTVGAANAWTSALSGVGKAATAYGLSQMGNTGGDGAPAGPVTYANPWVTPAVEPSQMTYTPTAPYGATLPASIVGAH